MKNSYKNLSTITVLLVVFLSCLMIPQQLVGLDYRFTKTEGPINMEADKLTYDQATSTIVLEGDVKITHKETILRADKVRFNEETKDAMAEGNVVLEEGGDILRCERLEINIETQKGVVYEGKLFLKKKNFHVTGSKAEKLGEMQYRVYDAMLTSCDADVASWKFSIKQLDVEVEGYAEGWWPAFHVKDVPVLYFPWAMFPVKKERQTGFLFPEFGTSSKWGPEITIPFYWVIAPNQDATFYFERIGDGRGRGFKPGIEYRYALSSRAKGQIKGYYIWDEIEDESRWSVFFDHDQTFPQGYYVKADVNWVSDKDYPVDFDDDIPDDALIDSRSRNHMESVLLMGKDWEWGALGAEFSYFRDLTVHGNDTTLQRLPQTTFFLYKNQFLSTPVFYEMEAEGTYFWREHENRGGRISMFPELSIPLKPFNMLRFEPWIGYGETVYFTDYNSTTVDEDTSREIFGFGATLGTTISRVFPLQGKRVRGVKHIIEPKVAYGYVLDVDQSDNPFFDDTDRMLKQNTIIWYLTNRLIGKEVTDDNKITYPEYAYFRIAQGYNFSHNLSSEQHVSNLLAELEVNPIKWVSGTMDLEYNPHHSRLDEFNSGIHFTDKREDKLDLEYRFTKDDVEQFNASLLIKTIDPLDFYFSYKHNLRDDVRIETVYGADYRHQCWEVSLRLHDINRSPDGARDDEIKFMVYFTLSGIGTYRLN